MVAAARQRRAEVGREVEGLVRGCHGPALIAVAKLQQLPCLLGLFVPGSLVVVGLSAEVLAVLGAWSGVHPDDPLPFLRTSWAAVWGGPGSSAWSLLLVLVSS